MKHIDTRPIRAWQRNNNCLITARCHETACFAALPDASARRSTLAAISASININKKRLPSLIAIAYQEERRLRGRLLLLQLRASYVPLLSQLPQSRAVPSLSLPLLQLCMKLMDILAGRVKAFFTTAIAIRASVVPYTSSAGTGRTVSELRETAHKMIVLEPLS